MIRHFKRVDWAKLRDMVADLVVCMSVAAYPVVLLALGVYVASGGREVFR